MQTRIELFKNKNNISLFVIEFIPKILIARHENIYYKQNTFF